MIKGRISKIKDRNKVEKGRGMIDMLRKNGSVEGSYTDRMMRLLLGIEITLRAQQ